MIVHIFFSADTMADSLLEAIERAWRVGPNGAVDESGTCWLPSSSWREGDDAVLSSLRSALLEFLNGRRVRELHINLLMSADRGFSAEDVNAAYATLQSVVECPAVRRMILLYPPPGEAGGNAHEKWEDLVSGTPGGRRSLCEVRMVLRQAAGEVAEEAAENLWDREIVEAIISGTFMGDCRHKLDSFLTGPVSSPMCSMVHGRLVFDRPAWQRYYLLRGRADLTAPETVRATAAVAGRAEKFVEDRGVVDWIWQPDLPGVSMPELGSGDPGTALPQGAVARAYRAILDERDRHVARCLETAVAQLAGISEEYRQLLADEIDRDTETLQGLYCAAHFHSTCAELVNAAAVDPERVASLKSQSVLPVCASAVGAVRSLTSASQGTEQTPGLADAPDRVHRAIAELRSARSNEVRGVIATGLEAILT